MSTPSKRYQVTDEKGVIIPSGQKLEKGEFFPEDFSGPTKNRLIHFGQIALVDYKEPKAPEPEKEPEAKEEKSPKKK